MLFGDFNYFRIGNRGKRVVKHLTERYTDLSQVAYVTSERVDAKLVLPKAAKVPEAVRELKFPGVDAYFEEQNVHFLNADRELMLTILASCAQGESLSAG